MMRKSAVNISIIIILFGFLITANGNHVCISNDVIKCYDYTNYAYCTVYQNNIDTISQAISFCSAGSFTELYLYIDSGLQDTTTIIILNLANNIKFISVYGYALLQPVYIISTQTHPNLSGITLNNLYIYNSGNFYAKFPNVKYLYVYSVYFDRDYNFSTLKNLTFLYIISSGQSNNTMDKEWVGGLSILQCLTLYRCGIQNITTDAFKNLTSLTYLNLAYNNILELSPEVFRDLTALRQLDIQNNQYIIKFPLDSKNNNAFSPLKQLTSLYLIYTNIIPFDAFATISSIKQLYLPRSSSGIVASTPFQHLHNLTYLSFYGISIICNCSMQWASIVPKFGITINGWCGGTFSNPVWNAYLYTECELTESYQCFNKSNSCNHACINTPDSYICACDAGYGLSQTETESVCHDIDECLLNTSHCEQKCRNTLGSYKCYCDLGYKLSDDLISCTDIDECSKSSWNTCEHHQCLNEVGPYRCRCDLGYQPVGDGYSCHDLDECSNASLNTCDQHICINELGTYTCICWQGYQLITNTKTCEDINECSLVESNSCSEHQCLNELGSYRCVCNEGFQLAVNNISCHDTDECMDANNSCNPHTCRNLDGSYSCLCGKGYELTSGGKSCEIK